METVAAAKGFLEKNGRNVTPVDNPRNKLDVKIAAFLAWPSVRVQQALSQLNAIESGELSKKAVETLPTIHAATTLHRQVKKAKEAGRPITKKKQIEIAKKASREADKSPTRVIENEFVNEIYPEDKEDRKTKELELLIDLFCRAFPHVAGNDVAERLETIKANRKEIGFRAPSSADSSG